MLQRLASGGAARATGVSGDLPMIRQAVAKHLAALQAAGLVLPSRQGREVRDELTPEPLTGAMSWIRGRPAVGRPALAAHLDSPAAS